MVLSIIALTSVEDATGYEALTKVTDKELNMQLRCRCSNLSRKVQIQRNAPAGHTLSWIKKTASAVSIIRKCSIPQNQRKNS